MKAHDFLVEARQQWLQQQTLRGAAANSIARLDEVLIVAGRDAGFGSMDTASHRSIDEV
jgi:hypothetical protein